MNSDLMLQIIYNSTVLLTISLIYEIAFSSAKNTKLHKIASGVVLGGIGMIIMSIPLTLQEGIIFDTRSILIGLTALYFGGSTTAVTALLMSAYRLWLGGAAAMTGILVITVSAILGLLWKKFAAPAAAAFSFKNTYAFGIVLHAVMLLCMLTLPGDTATVVLKAIAWPVMLLYPVTTVLLSKLIHDQRHRRVAIELIKEAEEKYKSLFTNHHTVMMIIDPDTGSIVDANPAAETFYGWTADQLKSMKVSDLNTLPLEDIKPHMQTARNNKRNRFVFKHRKANGHVADVEVYSGAILIQGKTYLYSIVHDIGDRLRAEAELKDSVERFRLLVESAPDAIFIQTHGQFSYVNDATLKLLGAPSPEALIGKQVMEFAHPDYKSAIQEHIHVLNSHQKAMPLREEILLKLDGTPVHTEVASVPVKFNETIGAIIFARDISERKANEIKRVEIESQLRHQQKLEAIGTLAGGVAHEINNPINGIINYAQLIMEEMETLSMPTEYPKEIIHESNRISEIVRNLLQFSRYEKQSHSYASLYDIINHTASLIKTVIRKDQIKFLIQMDECLPDLKCRSQQIQQVIMNLLTNARDALNEKYPGYHEDKMMILTCCQNDHGGRRWLRITVEDHGCGIPAETQNRIFEPFFSTKPKDVGTGLGLSISYGIVKEHHGDLSFDTVEGKMTRFILDLPVDNGWSIHDKE